MTINRNEFEPFNAQELIDDLNSAFAKRPTQEVPTSWNRQAEEAAFRRYCKDLEVWERDVWNPAWNAVAEAGIKLKFDTIAGRYYAKFDANGKERFTIRVTCKRIFDVMVSADNADEAKASALAYMDDEQKVAKSANKKPRFKYETTTEDTSRTIIRVVTV